MEEKEVVVGSSFADDGFDLPELDGPVVSKVRISVMDSVCTSCEG